MKKFLSCLLVVILLVSLVVSLVACDSDELKKLTYTDANGNEATVNVKKTSDVDQVTASLMGLAEKEVDRSTLSTLVASLALSYRFTGAEGDAAFGYEGNVSAKVGVGIPSVSENETFSSFFNKLKLYVGVNASGSLPTVMFDDTITSLCEKTEIDGSGDIYLDKSTIYTKMALSEATVALINSELEFDASTINNVTTKTNLGGIIGGLNKLIPAEEIFKAINEIKGSESYASLYEYFSSLDDKDTDTETDTETDDEDDFEFTYEEVKKFVQAFHVTITKTKGSVVTFSASINSETLAYLGFDEDLKEGEPTSADFKDSISLTVTLDAKTMADVSISLDVGALVKFAAAENTTATINDSSFVLNAYISTTEAIPTLSDEEKENATAGLLPIGDLISALMK